MRRLIRKLYSVLELIRVNDNHVVTDFNDFAVDLHITCDCIVVDVITKVFRDFAGFFSNLRNVIAGRTIEDIDWSAAARDLMTTARVAGTTSGPAIKESYYMEQVPGPLSGCRCWMIVSAWTAYKIGAE